MQVWPRDRSFGSLPRRHRLALRLVIAAIVLATVLYGSMRAYVEYNAHRASSMLAEASRVQIGDTEPSVVQLVRRYGGYKWTPPALDPKEDWIDKGEYEYQRNLQSDYAYILKASPFGFVTVADALTGRETRVDDALHVARTSVPAHLRAILGMRNWAAVVEFSIRSGRVQRVSANVLVEGPRWIGQEWELAQDMPRHDMQLRTYAIGSAILEMENGGGTAIENFLTPGASPEELQAARSFNAACLTSIAGCNGLCDFAPRTVEYLKHHPDRADGIVPPQCQ